MKLSRRSLFILGVLSTIVLGLFTLDLASGQVYKDELALEVEASFDRVEVFAVKSNTGSRRLIYTAAPGAIRDSLVALSPDEKYVALVEITDPKTMTGKLVLIDLETDKAVGSISYCPAMEPCLPTPCGRLTRHDWLTSGSIRPGQASMWI